MSETLIIGLATVILSAVSSLTLTNWRLNRIEERLSQHNGYAEKFAEYSKDMAIIQTDISYIKTAIEELKNKIV